MVINLGVLGLASSDFKALPKLDEYRNLGFIFIPIVNALVKCLVVQEKDSPNPGIPHRCIHGKAFFSYARFYITVDHGIRTFAMNRESPSAIETPKRVYITLIQPLQFHLLYGLESGRAINQIFILIRGFPCRKLSFHNLKYHPISLFLKNRQLVHIRPPFTSRTSHSWNTYKESSRSHGGISRSWENSEKNKTKPNKKSRVYFDFVICFSFCFYLPLDNPEGIL